MYKTLLIDDEKYVLASLKNRIEWRAHGFEVAATACNGEEGCALIRELRPDLVFTDIKMPGISGIDLIRMMTSEFPDVLFVVISGYAEFKYAQQAIEYGVRGFCTKPFDEDEIHTLLDRLHAQLDARRPGERERLASLDASRRRQLLSLHDIMPDESKVVIAFLRQSGPKLWKSHRLLSFSIDDDFDGYLIAADGRESLVADAPAAARIGVSSIFYDESYTASAIDEARTAALDSFITAHAVNLYRPAQGVRTAPGLDRRLRAHFELQEYREMNRLLAQAARQFKERTSSVEDALRLLHTSASLTEDAQWTAVRTPLAMALHFGSVYAMLDSLKEGLEHAMMEKEVVSTGGVIGDVLAYLHKNYYDSSLTLENVSKHFGFNPNYISQLFKKTKNERFTTYLTRLRIRHAEGLLTRSDDPISVIAEKVGYTEYFYFAKVFRRITGETPGDYRKRHRASNAVSPDADAPL